MPIKILTNTLISTNKQTDVQTCKPTNTKIRWHRVVDVFIT